MECLSTYTMNHIQNHTWTLRYDEKTSTAMLVNEHGEEMDFAAFAYILDVLNHRLEDLEAFLYQRETRVEPLDELTRKRMKLRDYQLISHKKDGDTTTSVFEVYSDRFRIFTLDCYDVYHNRKIYDDGFLAYLNESECRKLLKSLSAFVKRCESEWPS